MGNFSAEGYQKKNISRRGGFWEKVSRPGKRRESEKALPDLSARPAADLAANPAIWCFCRGGDTGVGDAQ